MFNIGSKIDSFIEKPDLEKAKEFISDKRYLWNSGIFMFKAKTILNEVKLFVPNIFEDCKNSLKHKLFDLDFQRLNTDDFPNVQISQLTLL